MKVWELPLPSRFPQRKINDTKYHKELQIPIMDDDYIYGKNDLFALIIIMKQMLKSIVDKLVILWYNTYIINKDD